MAQGRFIPTHPEKYMGNPNQIVFRSSWELVVCKFLDKSTGVKRWASEEVAIPYVSPKDGRVHRYFPDFFFEMINTKMEIERWLVEVKPLKETSHEHAKTVHDKIAVAVNEAKWAAARNFSAINNMQFRVITELDIFKMAPKKPRAAKKSAVSTRKAPAAKTGIKSRTTVKKPVRPGVTKPTKRTKK